MFVFLCESDYHGIAFGLEVELHVGGSHLRASGIYFSFLFWTMFLGRVNREMLLRAMSEENMWVYRLG